MEDALFLRWCVSRVKVMQAKGFAVDILSLEWRFHPIVGTSPVTNHNSPMGILDSTKFSFSCPKCGATGKASSVQKGSMHSADEWSTPHTPQGFSTTWEYEGKGCGYTAKDVYCTHCKAPAEVSAS